MQDLEDRIRDLADSSVAVDVTLIRTRARQRGRRQRLTLATGGLFAGLAVAGAGLALGQTGSTNERVADGARPNADISTVPQTAQPSDASTGTSLRAADVVPSCGTMPPFDVELTPAQIDDVIDYVRSLDPAIVATDTPIDETTVAEAASCGPTTYCLATQECYELTEQQLEAIIAHVKDLGS